MYVNQERCFRKFTCRTLMRRMGSLSGHSLCLKPFNMKEVVATTQDYSNLHPLATKILRPNYKGNTNKTKTWTSGIKSLKATFKTQIIRKIKAIKERCLVNHLLSDRSFNTKKDRDNQFLKWADRIVRSKIEEISILYQVSNRNLISKNTHTSLHSRPQNHIQMQ